MSEAVWAVLAFLLGWKLSGGKAPSASTAAHAVSASAKNTVHQAVAQASSDAWNAVWTVAWHVILIAAVALALLYGASVVLRAARRNVTGR